MVSRKIHLDRQGGFLHEFNLQQLVISSFRGYLGKIEPEETKGHLHYLSALLVGAHESFHGGDGSFHGKAMEASMETWKLP